MFVGRGVGADVFVGGMGVLVGRAAWVSATIVHAAASADAATSAALMVGSASAPQALTNNARAANNTINFFITCNYSLDI